jgi:hypothetical protein
VERRLRLILLASVLISLGPRRARGQESTVDARARGLQKSAMEDDYLNVDLDKAAEKLNQAIGECGDKCGANLRALLRRDLAVVYCTAGKRAEAVAMMYNALRIDGGVELDPNFKTREIAGIFAEARNVGGAGPASAAGAPAVPSATAGKAARPPQTSLTRRLRNKPSGPHFRST